ncbi:MAG: Bug family tripartite tricarboxylate transporter substrate binding protein [Burkholderiales bacterium]
MIDHLVRRISSALLLGVMFSISGLALAFPTKPVSIIVPQAPGGANEVLARMVASKLQEYWGSPVLVDFKPGGGVIVGTQFVARSTPDGHVIGIITSAHAINPALGAKLPYDSVRDFIPVARMGFNVLGLVVVPSLGVEDVKGLIELARQKPDALSHGSNGIGLAAHLAAELFKTMTGTKMVHVPYKGGAPLYQDMLGGRVPVAFAILASAVPLVRAGKLKVLGVTNAQRSVIYPDYPPISATVPGYELTTWSGFMVTAGTPREVVQKISADVIRVANAPELRVRFQEYGYEPAPLGLVEFEAFIRAETESKGKLARDAGAKFE